LFGKAEIGYKKPIQPNAINANAELLHGDLMLSLRVTNTSGTCVPFAFCALTMISSVIAVVTAAAPAHAQGELTDEELAAFYDDDESVSIATGTSKPLHRAPAVASVITADDIRKMGARTLDEVLETVPGLHVSRSFNRLNSVYSIRGIHTGNNPQVQLLLNGTQLVDTVTGGRPPTFSMPVANIERIEVIRGPGSAVYGADAFAGVIDVITKDADDIGGTVVGARAGSFDSQDAWVQSGFTEGELKAKLSLEYSHSDGDHDRVVNSDVQSLIDQQLNISASKAPGALDTNYETFNGEIKVSRGPFKFTAYRWEQHGAGVGPGSSQALDPTGEQDVEYQLYDLRYEKSLSDDWTVNYKLVHADQHQQAHFTLLPAGTMVLLNAQGNITFDPSTATSMAQAPTGLLGNPGGRERDSQTELSVFYRGFAGHVIRVAVGGKLLDFNIEETKNFGPGVTSGSDTILPALPVDVSNTEYAAVEDAERTARWATVQDEWGIAQDWELTAGVRFDSYSDFGDTINPRLALVWEAAYNLTSKLLYGRAFRAPSFDELYIQNNPSVQGNKLLDPEVVDTLELAFDYRPVSDVVTKLNLFIYQTKDVIEFVAGDTARVAQNVKDQEGKGFELEMRWDVTRRFSLTGNISLQESEDEVTRTWVPEAPRLHSYVAANWAFTDAWSWQVNANHVAGRKRAPADMRDSIDDYTLFNTSLSYRIAAANVLTTLAVKNIFDEDASEPSSADPTGVASIPDDYPLEGRSIWFDVEYRY